MNTINLTDAELEAARWAVGNFAMGDADDCQGKKRLKAMRSACAKFDAAYLKKNKNEDANQVSREADCAYGSH